LAAPEGTGLLEKKNLPRAPSRSQKLNSSFSNLDVIYPGDKIVIPLTITPAKGLAMVAQKGEETPSPSRISRI